MLTLLVIFAVASAVASILCLMGKCPPGVPCLTLSVCVLIQCIPSK